MALRIAIPVLSDQFENYLNALSACGGEGRLIFTPEDADPASFDGLLLPGGADVDPACYHETVHGAVNTNPDLDRLQLAVLDRYYKAGKPIFGICRGHQLLNVYFGGTLIQDLPTSGTHAWDREHEADRVHGNRANDSWISGLYGNSFSTNSAHHEAVERLGKGLVVDMWSDDGVVEAMHHENMRIFSVQWHPERMCLKHKREDTVDGSKVIRFFMDLCSKAAEKIGTD